MFLYDKGEKISKSKGNGISIDEWLSYASADSLSYFMYLKPKTAKRMHFDVIPKAVDEYHQQLRAFHDQDLKQQLNNPVYHIHNANVPKSDMVISFSMSEILETAFSMAEILETFSFCNLNLEFIDFSKFLTILET